MRALMASVWLAAVLSACHSATDLSDLQQLVAEAEVSAASQRMPPESAAEAAVIHYNAQQQRSPFAGPLALAKDERDLSLRSLPEPVAGGRADSAHLVLAELTLVGTLSGWHRAKPQALFRDRDGHIHALAVGDVVGENQARVVVVTESQVELLARVPLPDGGWTLAPRTFLLQQKPSIP